MAIWATLRRRLKTPRSTVRHQQRPSRQHFRSLMRRQLYLEALEARLPLAVTFNPSLNTVFSTGGDNVDFHFNSPSPIVDIYANFAFIVSVNANHLFFNDPSQTSSVEVIDHIASGPNSYAIIGTGTTGLAGRIELQSRGKSVTYQGANEVQLRTGGGDSNTGVYPRDGVLNNTLFPKVYIYGGLGQNRVTVDDAGYHSGEYYRLSDNKLTANRTGDVVLFPNSTPENRMLVSLLTGNGHDTVEVRNDIRQLASMKSSLNQLVTNGGNDLLRFDDLNALASLSYTYQFTEAQAIINGITHAAFLPGLENIELTSGNGNDVVTVGSSSGSLTGVPNIVLTNLNGGTNQINVIDTGFNSGADYVVSTNFLTARSLPNSVFFYGATSNYQLNFHTGAGPKNLVVGSVANTMQAIPVFNWATLGGSGDKLLTVHDEGFAGEVSYTVEEDRLIINDTIRNLGTRVYFPASPLNNPLLQVNVLGGTATNYYLAEARSRKLNSLPHFGIFDSGGTDYLAIDDALADAGTAAYTFNQFGGGSTSAPNRIFYNQAIENLYFDANNSTANDFTFDATDHVIATLPDFYVWGPVRTATVNDAGSVDPSTTRIARTFTNRNLGDWHLQYDSLQNLNFSAGSGDSVFTNELGPQPGAPLTNLQGGLGNDRIIYDDTASATNSQFTIENGKLYRGTPQVLVGQFADDVEEIELRGGTSANVLLVLQRPAAGGGGAGGGSGNSSGGPGESTPGRSYLISGNPLELEIDATDLPAQIALVSSTATGDGSTYFPSVDVTVSYTETESLLLEAPAGGLANTAGYSPLHYELNVVESAVSNDLPPILDINTTATGDGRVPMDSSNAGALTNVNGIWFLTANDGIHGHELWRTDGTQAGTVMVKDILPGAPSSSVSRLTNVNGTLFFVANDGIGGAELWKSDGTTAGTVRVKDISSGALGSYPNNLVNLNGVLYFTANDGISGNELWRSDGSQAGTVLVKDIGAGAASSYFNELTEVGGVLYFGVSSTYYHAGGTEFWKSNGTAAGTVMVKHFQTGTSGLTMSNLTNVNGTLFFRAFDNTNGNELWRSNGDISNTVLVKDINPGAASSDPRYLLNANGTLYFAANDGATGIELWRSNGSADNTVPIKDISSGGSSYPSRLVNIGGTVYFSAAETALDRELWKTDGTAPGTVLVRDIRFGSEGSDPSYLTNVGGTLYFSANDGANGRELWRSEGAEMTTWQVKNIQPFGSSFPYGLTNIDGKLYFQANDADTGYELWSSDGTYFGTQRVKDIRTGGGSANPQQTVAVGNIVYFTANDGSSGEELWRSDGTQAGTYRVIDLVPGSGSSSPRDMVNISGTLYFAAGNSLWKSLGDEGSTEWVEVNFGLYPEDLTNVGGTLFFTAMAVDQFMVPIGYRALFRLDNDLGEAFLVTDISGIGPVDMLPSQGADDSALVSVGTNVYFRAGQSVFNPFFISIWRSDGSAGGTLSLETGHSNILPTNGLANVGGTLYFSNQGPPSETAGVELWKSVGTPTGTVLVKDILPGTGSSNPGNFADLGGIAIFSANNGTNGEELWRSNGTELGTTLVKDIRPGPVGSNILNTLSINGTVYFTADDGVNGVELWKSDGTASGTVLVRDINPGATGSSPSNLFNANGVLYFTANDGTGGTELWKSDGTEAGTVLVTDVSQSGGSSPSGLTVAGNKLFFSASTETYGREMYAIDLTSVVGSYVYHKGSTFDAGGTNIPAALDTGKQLAKEGLSAQQLGFNNLINTTRGINGLVFDIAGLPAATLSASDFQFQWSPQGAYSEAANPPASWQVAPAPTSISVQSGATPRVVLAWPDQTIMNRWLRVTIQATPNTGLTEPEVYYLGHLKGEVTGSSTNIFSVNYAQDLAPIRLAVGTNVGPDSLVDIDKNGLIQFADIVAMRSNAAQQLPRITIPAAIGGGGGSVSDGGDFEESISSEANLKIQPDSGLLLSNQSLQSAAYAAAVDSALDDLYSTIPRRRGRR